MKLSIVGTGYVGLISGLCLSEKGHHVTCVDVDTNKVGQINQGHAPIHEKGLEGLLNRNVGHRFFATTDLRQAVSDSTITVIAVGTPFDGNQIDLTSVKKASREIGLILRDKSAYHVVVVKSTVVPGTTEETVLPLLEEGSGKEAGKSFGVGMNPEFLREGDAVNDFMNPDRILLGGIDDRSVTSLKELYSVFGDVDIVETTCRTAEMIKYTANALLATMVSFSNEMANLCAAVDDVDVVDVMRGVHLDKRLTPILPGGARTVPEFLRYLEAGCGFGGSCLPKDVKALRAFGEQRGQSMRLMAAVLGVNAEQYKQVMHRLYKHFPRLEGVTVAVLGLAFKPGTDDVRGSPAIPIVQELLGDRAKVKAFDPIASREAQRVLDNQDVEYCATLESTIEDVDAVLVLTRWSEFARLPDLLRQMVCAPVVIDARRMLDKHEIPRYEGIGLRASQGCD